VEVGIFAAPICRSRHEKRFTTENAEFTELKRKHDGLGGCDRKNAGRDGLRGSGQAGATKKGGRRRPG